MESNQDSQVLNVIYGGGDMHLLQLRKNFCVYAYRHMLTVCLYVHNWMTVSTLSVWMLTEYWTIGQGDITWHWGTAASAQLARLGSSELYSVIDLQVKLAQHIRHPSGQKTQSRAFWDQASTRWWTLRGKFWTRCNRGQTDCKLKSTVNFLQIETLLVHFIYFFFFFKVTLSILETVKGYKDKSNWIRFAADVTSRSWCSLQPWGGCSTHFSLPLQHEISS